VPLGVRVNDHASDDARDEQNADAARDDDERLLRLVLGDDGELTLVLLLVLHLLHARLILCIEPGLLDLAVTNGLEACGLFTRTLLFGAALLFNGAKAGLFLLTHAAVGLGADARSLLLGAALLVFFLTNSVFFEIHQLFEREEDGAFFLFGHERDPTRQTVPAFHTRRK